MKKTSKNNMLTPEQYIRQKARTLPLGQCYMNKNWFISGIAIGVVTRCHNKGTFTVGVFQMDTFCSGISECKVEFSLDKTNYTNMINFLTQNFKIEPVTYTEVHNLIYGALEFGKEAGFTVPNSFHLAQYILDEDTEDIPLINYQYGKEGKHFLLAESERELDVYMPHLISHLGKENVLFGLIGVNQLFRGEDFYDSKTRALMRSIVEQMNRQEELPIEAYSYVHPEYPTELNLKHAELADVIFSPDNGLFLTEEKTKEILALPHDELRADLEQILLYETGKTCDEITDEMCENKNTALLHCLILLGELGCKESLPAVLETLCQKKEFYDFHLGALLNEIYVPTLYLLGKDQLDKFYEFVQIPGLYTFARYLIFPAVAHIAKQEPERREEVIEWFRKVLVFYADKLNDKVCCDGTLIGLISIDLLKLQAVELLPELKVLYETGKVDIKCCGNFDKIEKQMGTPQPENIVYLFTISERYKELQTRYEQIAAEQAEMARQAAMNQAAANNRAAETEEEAVEEVVELKDDAEAPVQEENAVEVVAEEVTEKESKAKAEKKTKKTPAKPRASKAKAKASTEGDEPKEAAKATKAKRTSKKETSSTAAEEKKPRAKRASTKKTKTAETEE